MRYTLRPKYRDWPGVYMRYTQRPKYRDWPRSVHALHTTSKISRLAPECTCVTHNVQNIEIGPGVYMRYTLRPKYRDWPRSVFIYTQLRSLMTFLGQCF
jgi:hypothetical protein